MRAPNKVRVLPLEILNPRWVEFTGTKGVLRVLRPEENARKQARGMIFNCPRCRHDPKKAHYCIFLFPSAPPEARPHGRFIIGQTPGGPWGECSLWMIPTDGASVVSLLQPGDLKCGWEGFLHGGQVSWMPSLMERLRSE